jgi:PAS domain-containing protein
MQAASSSQIAGATNDIVSVPAVVHQLRVNISVVAGLQLLYLAMESQNVPGLAQHLFKLNTINLGLLGLALLLTFGQWFGRHWHAATLIFCALLLSVGTAISVLGRMPDIHIATLALFSIGCAVFVPWETNWQATLNLFCLVSLAISDAYTPSAHVQQIERLFGLLVVLMLAQFAARLVGGYRESLYSQIESIRKAEAKLRAVLNSAPDATIVADGNGTITMANPQTGKLFGYDPAELLGS